MLDGDNSIYKLCIVEQRLWRCGTRRRRLTTYHGHSAFLRGLNIYGFSIMQFFVFDDYTWIYKVYQYICL